MLFEARRGFVPVLKQHTVRVSKPDTVRFQAAGSINCHRVYVSIDESN